MLTNNDDFLLPPATTIQGMDGIGIT